MGGASVGFCQTNSQRTHDTLRKKIKEVSQLFKTSYVPTLRKTWFSICKSIGGGIVTFFSIGYCIGADLHVVI